MAIGTALAIGSMAISAAGGASNFINASKQQKLQRQAELDAKKAFDEARRQLNVNPYAALGIQKEPYELEREASLSQGAQAISAAQEGDRGAAEAAGRVQMAQNEAQAGVRTAMGKEMQDLSKLTAEEQANIKAQQAGLSLQEAQGYQTQAKEAKEARAKLIESGMQNFVDVGQMGIQQFLPLYLSGKDSKTTNQMGNISAAFTPAGSPNGPSNYVMQDQQRQSPSASSLTSSWMGVPQVPRYNPYNQNPFLFYQNPPQ